jgi:sulfite reductase (NADPH) hemoprotein beta-component
MAFISRSMRRCCASRSRTASCRRDSCDAAHIARTYDRGYGHFTTRQNIQLNWPQLEQVPDILAELARVEMHAIQTSGNCVRNITSDHFAGVAGDETSIRGRTAELLRQWSTFHPSSPTSAQVQDRGDGATNDRAAILVHDIGLQLVSASARRRLSRRGRRRLGRTPIIGHVIREFCRARRS